MIQDDYRQNPGREDAVEDRTGSGCRVLVLGVGNDMMGDDGIGVHVVRSLSEQYEFPPDVTIVDGGVGGMSLLPVIRTAGEVVIVDAIEASAKPGSIFMFNSVDLESENAPKLSLHDTGILEVIRTASLMGEALQATIIGIQPKRMDEFGSPLSKQVKRNIPKVLEIIIDLLEARGCAAGAKGSVAFSGENDTDHA